MKNLELRIKAIEAKELILKNNRTAFEGNSNSLKNYKTLLNKLIPNLTPFQLEASIGLVLGDGSIGTSDNRFTTRLVCQQSIIHDEWMRHLRKIFEEYITHLDLPNKLNNREIRELSTFKVQQFNTVGHIITNDLTLPFPGGGTKLKRQITESLRKYITPVCVAYMFGSDGQRTNGGTRSQSPSGGKGVQLNFQSFSKTEVDLLSEMINTELSKVKKEFPFNTRVKESKISKAGVQQYVIDFPGSDYASFVAVVGPYIHESMHCRVPLARVNHKYGLGDKKFVDYYLGTKVRDYEIISSYKNWTKCFCNSNS